MWTMLLPCGKLICSVSNSFSFLFCFLNLPYIHKTFLRTERALLVMGTIFLVYIYIHVGMYVYDCLWETPPPKKM